ncbi:hypothetical protein [Leptospira sp. GIMC2001]|uniref:hypothetical protein n=1 Tax=Leptospira sp. GIMC2001 TaxID=1513297 RepID=UPI0023491F44|nr:hypothetical protein [Leptospira sp. GIMC2001]WCL49335.1 hypothetical protein O4O04_18905 [Leptospira sp. GIMC2001]
MNFKSYIIKTIAVSALATLAINCHPEKVEDDALLAGLVASQIRGLASGSCAISINHAGLRYGAIVQTAVTQAGTASGVYTNATFNGGIDTFGQTQYEAVTGSSISAQGFASYSDVPYNLKYDAFFGTGGDTWTDAKRNAALVWTKTFRDYFLFIGHLAVSDNAGAAAAFPTGAGATVVSLIAASGNPVSCNSFVNYVTNCAAITTTLAASFGVVDRTDGTGTLACAKIPRANCSIAGLTTANREADIKSQSDSVAVIANEPACRKPGVKLLPNVQAAAFKGLPNTVPVSLVTGVYNQPNPNPVTTSIDRTISILPEKAYPKFGSLVGLGFGALMPINKNNQKFVLSAESYAAGINLSATPVDNCEQLGMNRGISVELPNDSQSELTSAREISYALSPSGTAASLYAGQISASGGSSTDAIACNRTLRSKFPISVALGGGKLPDLQVTSGNGGETQLLSVCVYGGSEATRAFPKALLASGLSTATGTTITAAQIAVCGEGKLTENRAALQNSAKLFEEVGSVKENTVFPNTSL